VSASLRAVLTPAQLAELDEADEWYAYLDGLTVELLERSADRRIRSLVGGPLEPLANVLARLYRVSDDLGYSSPPAPARVLTAKERRRQDADRAAARAFRRIGERDGFRCRACGIDRTLTVDHVIAVENGGSDEDENFQLLCRSHNSAKGTT
jgi:hypothetical protein